MKITDAGVVVTGPGRNFVTLKIETDQGVGGIGDATLNGREPAVTYERAYLPVNRLTDGTLWHLVTGKGGEVTRLIPDRDDRDPSHLGERDRAPGRPGRQGLAGSLNGRAVREEAISARVRVRRRSGIRSPLRAGTAAVRADPAR